MTFVAFTNHGADTTWIPFDVPGTGYQAAVAEMDPTTGLPRLIFGNSQGIWSVVDNNGVAETTLGTSTPLRRARIASATFNSHSFTDGGSPSNVAAQIAGSLFYGAAQDVGGPGSDADILSNGDLDWSGDPLFAEPGREQHRSGCEPTGHW